MPHKIHFNADAGYIIVCYTGIVNLEELDEVRQEIESHPDFRPGLDRLWDERACEIQMSHEDLTEIAKRWAGSKVDHGNRKLAYLVSQDLFWGFNRVFESYRENPAVDFQIFHEFELARKWLALPADLEDPSGWLT